MWLLQRLPNEAHHFGSPYYTHGRRPIDFDTIKRTYDYNDSSSRLFGPRTPMHILHPAQTSYPKKTVKIYQPREDPKLYYQSDAYLKEINLKNIDHEVTGVYPDINVIRAAEYENPRMLLRKSRREGNRFYTERDHCVRCPHDRTLVTKAGSDRVVLLTPRLFTCSGHRASSEVRLVDMYGPKFGSLLTRGDHNIIARITYNDKTLQLCKIKVHVIVQSCFVPKYLVTHCNEGHSVCNFTCKNSNYELQGEASSVCGDDMKWENELPVCRARSWCYAPIPPEDGRISCKGATIEKEAGLVEGSRCRIRCAQTLRPTPRAVTVCRRGVWTHNLSCQPRNRSSKI